MHSPVRSMFVVNAPVARGKAILDRRSDLRDIVHNEWIRLFVHDTETKKTYKQQNCGEYVQVDAVPSCSPVDNSMRNEAKFVPFTNQLEYCQKRKQWESAVFLA